MLADWTARHVPSAVAAAVTHDECRAAIDSLLARGLLVELTADDLAHDLARWNAERVPSCVDLYREVCEVDFTPRGADTMRTLDARLHPTAPAADAGYIDDQQGTVRVFGATEESCDRLARSLIAIPPADLRGASLALTF